MLKIYNIKDQLNFIDEVSILTQKEWGKSNLSASEFDSKIRIKKQKILNNLNNPLYCKLLLIDETPYSKTLIGFISIFPQDGDKRADLFSWYSTMFVKEAFRGRGYSKILNNAILKEAKNRGFKKLYLKTTFSNYYEKFGAKYIENLSSTEKLYYFDIK